MSADRYVIETPEQIAFDYDLAGLGSRALAALLDTLLLLLAEGGLLVAAIAVYSQIKTAERPIIAVSVVLAFLIFWGYYIVFETLWSGQSPGKRAVGLRVVREGGRPVTFIATAIRNLIRIVDFLPLFYGIGMIVMFVDGKARRLGDLAGGTLVVRERPTLPLAALVALAAAPAAVPGDQRLAGLDERGYALAQEFLAQRALLEPQVRQQLAAQLANAIYQRLGVEPGAQPELYIEQAVAAYVSARRPS